MNRILITGISSLFLFSFAFVCCGGRASQGKDQAQDVPEDSLQTAVILQGARDLNDLAAVFAGMPVDSSSKYFSSTKTDAWKRHSASIGKLWDRCEASLKSVGDFCRDSIPDVVAGSKTALYTFSGPDFGYPAVIFPEADTLILAAWEPLGTPLTEKNLGAKTFSDYNTALSCYLRNSYFITKSMKDDLGNEGLGGVIPVFMFYLPRMGYQILSVETPAKDRLIIKYFRPEENREKVLRYYKVNLKNGAMDSDFKEALEALDPSSTGSLVKACSYCLHESKFSEIRDLILSHSSFIVQDDTGPRYKELLQGGFDVKLYGGYVRPLSVFGPDVFQADLQNAYGKECRGAIPFRFGYNAKSSFIVSRKP